MHTKALSEFEPGDLIVWRRERRGGYGYVEKIPGVVAAVGQKRVSITVKTTGGDTKQVSVKPENLLVMGEQPPSKG